jgi:hypothetical protein
MLYLYRWFHSGDIYGKPLEPTFMLVRISAIYGKALKLSMEFIFNFDVNIDFRTMIRAWRVYPRSSEPINLKNKHVPAQFKSTELNIRYNP